jgi:predicted transcriptional regulator
MKYYEIPKLKTICRQMTEHNVGALVVVKPGDEKVVAGIVTERGTLNFLNISTLL